MASDRKPPSDCPSQPCYAKQYGLLPTRCAFATCGWEQEMEKTMTDSPREKYWEEEYYRMRSALVLTRACAGMPVLGHASNCTKTLCGNCDCGFEELNRFGGGNAK